MTATVPTSYHERRLARRLQSPEYRDEFERASREIRTIDMIVNSLDDLRTHYGVSKAALAREIGKNPASVRRLFTTSGNPELRTIVAMADALDADVKIVPRAGRRPSRGKSQARAISRSGERTTTSGATRAPATKAPSHAQARSRTTPRGKKKVAA